MKSDQLLRAILPEVLIDNFDINRFEKSDTRFDIWLDEKKEQLSEDKYNKGRIVINHFLLAGKCLSNHSIFRLRAVFILSALSCAVCDGSSPHLWASFFQASPSGSIVSSM